MRISVRLAGRDLAWAALSVLGLLSAGWIFLTGHGADLHAYWTVDLGDIYGRTTEIQVLDGYFYAPPVALLMSPIKLIPWPVARLLWICLQIGALRYVAGRWALAAILLPPIWIDLYYGNLYILFAAMVVAGFRHPSAWLFGLLTKVTPGIGLVWFAVRREWAHVAQAVAVLAGIIAISMVVQGVGTWTAWIATLRHLATLPIAPDALQVPLVPRIAVAVAIVAGGARANQRWAVPVAMTVSMPTLWPAALVPLLAIPSVTAFPVTWEAAMSRRLAGQLRAFQGSVARAPGARGFAFAVEDTAARDETIAGVPALFGR